MSADETIADCVLMPLADIRPTEEVCPHRVGEVVASILDVRTWTHPICVEGTVGALLDGHHRLAAARLLGLSRIPVHIFDYGEVDLDSWRPELAPTREDVLARALSGELYPRKTTRHAFVARTVRPIPLSSLVGRDVPTTRFRDVRLRPGPAMWQGGLEEPARWQRRRG